MYVSDSLSFTCWRPFEVIKNAIENDGNGNSIISVRPYPGLHDLFYTGNNERTTYIWSCPESPQGGEKPFIMIAPSVTGSHRK
jgi:hypothetical protein